jgi:P-type Mg2+ transporter
VAAVAPTIAGDAVDWEQPAKPRSWDIRSIRMVITTAWGWSAHCSTWLRFAVLCLGLEAGSTRFCSGWFLESPATELAAMLVLLNNRRFWLSKPGRALLITSITVAPMVRALPNSPLAGVVGLSAVSLGMLAALVGVGSADIGVNEFVKVSIGLAA